MKSVELIALFAKQEQDNAAVFAQKIEEMNRAVEQVNQNINSLAVILETRLISETRDIGADLLLDRVGIQNTLIDPKPKVPVEDMEIDIRDYQKQSVDPEQVKIEVGTYYYLKQSVNFSSALEMLHEGSILEIMLTDNFPVYTGRNLSLGTFVHYLNRKGKWLDANVVYNGDDDGSVTLLNLFDYKFTTKIENVRLCFGSTVELKNSGYWVVIQKVGDANTYMGYASDASHCPPHVGLGLYPIPKHSVRFINNIMSASPSNFHPFVRKTSSYLKFCEFYEKEQRLHLEYLYGCLNSGLVILSKPLDSVSIFKQVEVLLLKDQFVNSADPLIPKTPITQQKINSILEIIEGNKK
jgi:hypothetical protein